jgi:hypothetical protein
MVCYECGMSLASSREISVKFGVPLCGNHLFIIEKILEKTLLWSTCSQFVLRFKKTRSQSVHWLVEWEKICPYIPGKTKNKYRNSIWGEPNPSGGPHTKRT